jgi:hypothetical protein
VHVGVSRYSGGFQTQIATRRRRQRKNWKKISPRRWSLLESEIKISPVITQPASPH